MVGPGGLVPESELDVAGGLQRALERRAMQVHRAPAQDGLDPTASLAGLRAALVRQLHQVVRLPPVPTPVPGASAACANTLLPTPTCPGDVTLPST